MGKRPLGIGAARLAKRQKLENAPPDLPPTQDEPPLHTTDAESLDTAVADLIELLETAQATRGDPKTCAPWYRAVINEADRLFRLHDRAQASARSAETEDMKAQRASLHTICGQALMSMGYLIATSDEDLASANEPHAVEIWYEAAQHQLDQARGCVPREAHPSYRFGWLDGMLQAHRLVDAPTVSGLEACLRAFQADVHLPSPSDIDEAAAILMDICTGLSKRADSAGADSDAVITALEFISSAYGAWLPSPHLAAHCSLELASTISQKLETSKLSKKREKALTAKLQKAASAAVRSHRQLLNETNEDEQVAELRGLQKKALAEALILQALGTEDPNGRFLPHVGLYGLIVEQSKKSYIPQWKGNAA